MNATINKFGFWAGMIAFVAAVLYVVVQLLQMMGVLHYPMDEILIYGSSLCIVIPFLLAMLALHCITPDEKRIWSHAALLFTTIYVIFVTANYIVQLATVIPMTLQGKDDSIEMLKQTAHSLFWDFDAIGYIFMGLATLFAVPVFEKQGWQKWVGYAFFIHAMVTPLIAYVYFYPQFSNKLLLIGLPWGITAPLSMLLLALMFKKNLVLQPQTKRINIKVNVRKS
jgi:hypothetical protein